MDVAEWDARYRTSDYVWTAGPNPFLVEQTADLTPGRALDIACGDGRNAVWLASKGFGVTGIDFSAVAIDKARQLADAKGVSVDWRVGDVTAAVPSGPFDLVVTLYLHVPEGEFAALLEAACAALAPGGTVLVIGHHLDNLADGHGDAEDSAILHDHRVIAGQLDANPAMSVVTATRVDRPVVDDDEHEYAIDSLVRAIRVGLD